MGLLPAERRRDGSVPSALGRQDVMSPARDRVIERLSLTESNGTARNRLWNFGLPSRCFAVHLACLTGESRSVCFESPIRQHRKKEIHFETDRNSEVVQRREGLWIHHLGEGRRRVRSFLRNSGQRLPFARRGRAGRVRSHAGPQGSAGPERLRRLKRHDGITMKGQPERAALFALKQRLETTERQGTGDQINEQKHTVRRLISYLLSLL